MHLDGYANICIQMYISTSKIFCNKLFLCARIVEHSWRWHVSLIYNYLCNQCLSPLKIWVRISFIGRCTRSKIMWSSWSVTYDRSVIFLCNSVSLIITTDQNDTAEISPTQVAPIALCNEKQTYLRSWSNGKR